MERIITEQKMENYRNYLRGEEKSENTIQKYMSDISKFVKYAGKRQVTKELMIGYKDYLKEMGYSARSINSYLVAVNGFLKYMEWYGVQVKCLKIQKDMFLPEERELTMKDYKRLVRTAKKLKKERLAGIITAICSLGIRVSELQFLTVESLKKGVMEVDNKGKRRKVLITPELQKELLIYIKRFGIKHGTVFCTRTGKAVHRTNIWKEMKMLCLDAGINKDRVFPHNLRHLFARIYYKANRDIVKLADILGHSSIETTRIYTRMGYNEYRRELSRMGLVLAPLEYN